MPDTLNKQSIINLLIDSPLREPIKINLIDIVNNTSEPDLPKVYSTITKELEIFQKATERRMKLADETIAKLGGGVPATNPAPVVPDMAPAPVVPPTPAMPLPPLDLPPLPQPMVAAPAPLTVPPLDLPPLPQTPTMPSSDIPPLPPTPVVPPAPVAPVATPAAPDFQALGSVPMASTSDEDALAEIQKELDSLKNEAAADIATAAAPATPVVPPTQQ